MDGLRECILHYYLALRLSAAASVPMSFTFDQLDSPAPVVRFTATRLDTGFDPREMIQDERGRAFVIVMDSGSRAHPHSILDN